MNIVKACLRTIFDLDPKAKYQVQYVDYAEGQWTAPVWLNKDRIHKISTEFSVNSIKVQCSSGEEITIDK